MGLRILCMSCSFFNDSGDGGTRHLHRFGFFIRPFGFRMASAAGEQRLQRRHDDQEHDGPISMPPTTTMASGRCTWLPMAVENAAGNSPMAAENAVIKTARMRCVAAWNMASPAGTPPLLISLK